MSTEILRRAVRVRVGPSLEAAKADPANHDPAKTECLPEGADFATPPAAETKAAPDPATVSQATDELRKYIANCKTNRINERGRLCAARRRVRPRIETRTPPPSSGS